MAAKQCKVKLEKTRRNSRFVMGHWPRQSPKLHRTKANDLFVREMISNTTETICHCRHVSDQLCIL